MVGDSAVSDLSHLEENQIQTGTQINTRAHQDAKAHDSEMFLL